MKNKWRVWIFIVICVGMFTACEKEKESSESESVVLKTNGSVCQDIKIFTEEEGSYSKLYYYDYKNDSEIAACNQANCSHSVSDYVSGKMNCNAIVEGEVSYPFLYKDKLYYFTNTQSAAELWKCETDGTGKEKIFSLDFDLTYSETVMKDGIVYVVSQTETSSEHGQDIYIDSVSVEIYAIDLENKKMEQISDFGTRAYAYISKISYFEDKLYIRYDSTNKSYEEAGFQDVNGYLKWMEESGENYSYKEDYERLDKRCEYYTYDCSTKKMEKFKINYVSDFEPYKEIEGYDCYNLLCVRGNMLYYFENVVGKKSIYSYNLETGECKNLFSKFELDIYCEGDTVYATAMEMDESTKDNLLPSVDYTKAPTYYKIDLDKEKVTQLDIGEEGKVLFICDVNEGGLLAYRMDFDQTYQVVRDEHSLCEIDSGDFS